ncbi:unnamed protein product [Spirodela intermedia]|uniref:Uncharacterized protein n=1 Tax=Spirodela intermedia TaxID=51605 RepID=A0A7I8IX99_SPIIN|nr:unnamed protein product [Spirodela intermedia]CAA6661791.1 unnamed protein product [Spirodela intermedia]
MRAAGHRLTGLRFRHLSPRPLDFLCFIGMESRAAISTEGTFLLNRDDLEFLPWLRRKSGREISSVLSIGCSTYGRSLFSSRYIDAGECILSVPYSVQITPDNIPSFLKPLIANDVGDIGRLAVVLLAERRRGQDSEWALYFSSLPYIDDMHCLVLDHFSEFFGDISLKSFMHAYALDFLNHNGNSENVLMDDEDNETSVVLIRYGKFPNATLLLDFGFALPENMYDQCSDRFSPLNSLIFSISFREVRSTHGTGKGIPPSLRAFARVLSAKSPELEEMRVEASENDGRLARRPLSSRSREIEAHRILISQIAPMIQSHNASIENSESYYPRIKEVKNRSLVFLPLFIYLFIYLQSLDVLQSLKSLAVFVMALNDLAE